jgi:hypothetical protein
MTRIRLNTGFFILFFASLTASAEDQLSGFLCCNMHSDGTAISDINVDDTDQHVIPVGTPLKVTGYRKHRVKVVVENKNQAIVNEYSRDLPIQEFAKRYIVQEDPGVRFKAYPKNIQYAIAAGHIVKGMTREQVIMSLGYPTSSENPNLNSSAWTFWLIGKGQSDKVQYRVNFDDRDRVLDVENTVDAKSIVLTE